MHRRDCSRLRCWTLDFTGVIDLLLETLLLGILIFGNDGAVRAGGVARDVLVGIAGPD